MRVFVAGDKLEEDFDQLLDAGITWTEYRVWRKIYEALMQTDRLEVKDAEAANMCRIERKQYTRAVEGLVKKGIIQSFGEKIYCFTKGKNDEYSNNYSDFPGNKFDKNHIRNNWHWEDCFYLLSEKAQRWVNELREEEKQEVFDRLKEEFS